MTRVLWVALMVLLWVPDAEPLEPRPEPSRTSPVEPTNPLQLEYRVWGMPMLMHYPFNEDPAPTLHVTPAEFEEPSAEPAECEEPGEPSAEPAECEEPAEPSAEPAECEEPAEPSPVTPAQFMEPTAEPDKVVEAVQVEEVEASPELGSEISAEGSDSSCLIGSSPGAPKTPLPVPSESWTRWTSWTFSTGRKPWTFWSEGIRS